MRSRQRVQTCNIPHQLRSHRRNRQQEDFGKNLTFEENQQKIEITKLNLEFDNGINKMTLQFDIGKHALSNSLVH